MNENIHCIDSLYLGTAPDKRKVSNNVCFIQWIIIICTMQLSQSSLYTTTMKLNLIYNVNKFVEYYYQCLINTAGHSRCKRNPMLPSTSALQSQSRNFFIQPYIARQRGVYNMKKNVKTKNSLSFQWLSNLIQFVFIGYFHTDGEESDHDH